MHPDMLKNSTSSSVGWFTKKCRKGSRFVKTGNGYSMSKSRKRRGIGGRPKKISADDEPTFDDPIDWNYSDYTHDDGPMTVDDNSEEPLAVTPTNSQQLGDLHSLSFSTPRKLASYPFLHTPQSNNLKGQGRINFSTLNSAVRQKEGHVACFEDEYGKHIYSHVRIPDRHLPLSQCSSEKTLKYLNNFIPVCSRRRSDDLLKLAELIVKEASGEKNDESIAKIIVSLLNRNKIIKKLVEKQLNISSISPIPAEKSLPMLVQLAHSKNIAEEIMSKINKHVGVRIFDPRNNYRVLYDQHDLKAKYEAEIIRVSKGDFYETIPVACMTNIREVLTSYVELMSTKIEVSSRTRNIYRIRIAVDKGGSDTKISVSFADSVFCQSPHGHLVVAAYEGSDINSYLQAAVSRVFESLSEIKELPRGDKMIPVDFYVVGDNKSISAVIGHAGQSSTNPCIVCPVDHWTVKIDGGMKTLFNKPRSEYITDDATASIVADPLISVNSKNIVPPALHNFLSPASALLQLIYEDAGYMDRCIIQNQEIMYQMLPSAKISPLKKGKGKELTKEGLENCQKTVSRVIDALKKQSNDTSNLNGCGLIWCYKRIGVKVAAKYGEAMADCIICKKMVHYFCNGDILPEKNKKKNSITCKSCLNSTINPIAMFEESVVQLVSQSNVEQYLKECRKTKGKVFQIDEICKELKITPQQYFGGILTGNDTRTFLENCQEITSVFTSHAPKNDREKGVLFELSQKYNDICKCLYDIQSFTKNDYLDLNEIQELEILCTKLPSLVKKINAMHLTPKIHGLAVHFPEFARNHGTLVESAILPLLDYKERMPKNPRSSPKYKY